MLDSKSLLLRPIDVEERDQKGVFNDRYPVNFHPIKILPEQILRIFKSPVGTLSLQQHYLVLALRVPFSSRKK
jgi:hypothetical protein